MARLTGCAGCGAPGRCPQAAGEPAGFEGPAPLGAADSPGDREPVGATDALAEGVGLGLVEAVALGLGEPVGLGEAEWCGRVLEVGEAVGLGGAAGVVAGGAGGAGGTGGGAGVDVVDGADVRDGVGVVGDAAGADGEPVAAAGVGESARSREWPAPGVSRTRTFSAVLAVPGVEPRYARPRPPAPPAPTMPVTIRPTTKDDRTLRRWVAGSIRWRTTSSIRRRTMPWRR